MKYVDIENIKKVNLSWYGDYKGIRYKISNWNLGRMEEPYVMDPIWNYYIYLVEEVVHPEDFAKYNLDPQYYEFCGKTNETYPYDHLDIDMHGGVTWYKKSTEWSPYSNRHQTIIEIGCDFNHSWDQGRHYTYDYIESQAKRTIDRLDIRLFKRCKFSGYPSKDEDLYRTCLPDNEMYVRKDVVCKIPVGWKNYYPHESESEEFKKWFEENVGKEDTHSVA